MKRVLLLTLALLLSPTAPARAVDANRACIYTGAVTGDGMVHAFGWCEYDENGSLAAGRGPELSRRAVPSFVVVLDVADDGRLTWVLTTDQTDHGTFVTAYDRSGRSVLRKRIGNTGSVGSLIARNGEFWAVYTQTRTVNGKSASVLFQAKTIGTNVLPTQISGASDVYDTSPALAFRPGGGVVLAWVRHPDDAVVDDRIRLATSADGRWSSRDFAAGSRVVMATAGSMTALAWQDSHGIQVADTGPTGRASLRPRPFLTGDGRAFGELLDVATDGRTAAVYSTGSDGVVRLGRRHGDGSYPWTAPAVRDGRHGSLLIRSGVPLLLTGTADNRAYADQLR